MSVTQTYGDMQSIKLILLQLPQVDTFLNNDIFSNYRHFYTLCPILTETPWIEAENMVWKVENDTLTLRFSAQRLKLQKKLIMIQKHVDRTVFVYHP